MDRPIFGTWPDPSDRATFESRTVYNLPLLEDFGDWLEFMADAIGADKTSAAGSATTAAEKVTECQEQVTLAAQKVTDCQTEVTNCQGQVTLAADKVTECQTRVDQATAAKTGAETGRDKSSEWASKPAASGTVDDGVNTPDLSAKAYAVDDLTGAAGGSAKDWATADEDVEVAPGQFSAKHWAEKSAKGERLTATSSTSIEIGTGSQIFTLVEPYRAFTAGSPIRISSQADLENDYMDGIVTDYDRDTNALTVNILAAPGTGTHADWLIGLRAAGDAATLGGVTLQQILASGFPSGGIIMWSGAIANIPLGWALCDGTNDTPDLRNRFIVGAGDSYSVDDVGGSKDAVNISHTHGHSLGTASAGYHTHTINMQEYVSGGSNPGGYQKTYSAGTYSVNGSGSHSHSMSGSINSAGESGTDKNLPPYFALAYIMKL